MGNDSIVVQNKLTRVSAVGQPPKIRDGSIRINSTGIKPSKASAARIFLLFWDAPMTKPAAAPLGLPTAAPLASEEIALPVLRTPQMLWAVLAACVRLFSSLRFSSDTFS